MSTAPHYPRLPTSDVIQVSSFRGVIFRRLAKFSDSAPLLCCRLLQACSQPSQRHLARSCISPAGNLALEAISGSELHQLCRKPECQFPVLGGEMRPRDYLREYFIAFDQQPAGLLYMFQPSRGNDRMLMHRQAGDTGWGGFWNFHDGGRVLSGTFQTRHGSEYNFQACLDSRLGRAVYRGSAVNIEDDTEREIILCHDSTYIRYDSASPRQRRWQSVREIRTVDCTLIDHIYGRPRDVAD